MPDKYPLSVQNIKHRSKSYVNIDIAEIWDFYNRYQSTLLSEHLDLTLIFCCIFIKQKFGNVDKCILDVGMPFYAGRLSDQESVSQS